jgi:hypothetical protein
MATLPSTGRTRGMSTAGTTESTEEQYESENLWFELFRKGDEDTFAGENMRKRNFVRH